MTAAAEVAKTCADKVGIAIMFEKLKTKQMLGT
jgi:hypothetical protein